VLSSVWPEQLLLGAPSAPAAQNSSMKRVFASLLFVYLAVFSLSPAVGIDPFCSSY
jgi:hypothetical protein